MGEADGSEGRRESVGHDLAEGRIVPVVRLKGGRLSNSYI